MPSGGRRRRVGRQGLRGLTTGSAIDDAGTVRTGLSRGIRRSPVTEPPAGFSERFGTRTPPTPSAAVRSSCPRITRNHVRDARRDSSSGIPVGCAHPPVCADHARRVSACADARVDRGHKQQTATLTLPPGRVRLGGGTPASSSAAACARSNARRASPSVSWPTRWQGEAVASRDSSGACCRERVLRRRTRVRARARRS